jgi:RNA polymerase sigma factor (sigma-70 family)
MYRTFDDFAFENEVYQLLYDAINSLPPNGKQVIELSMDGLKNKEIAKSLNISVNTVKTLKLRAYKFLREKLKKIYFNFFMFKPEEQLPIVPLKTKYQ